MKHNFENKTVLQLIELRGEFMETLKNEKCEPIHENYRKNIEAVNAELLSRGIKSLLKSKQ